MRYTVYFKTFSALNVSNIVLFLIHFPELYEYKWYHMLHIFNAQ